MTLTLVIAATVLTAVALVLHLLILIRAIRQSRRIGLSYVLALVVAVALWLVAYYKVTETTGQVSQEGMKQFEAQKQMLDDMDDLQIELPSKQ